MKFAEAMRNLEEGKKVRIKSWSERHYVSLNTHKEIIDEYGKVVGLGSCLTYEWELYNDVVKLCNIPIGRLFKYSGDTYRRLDSYMLEYAPTKLAGFTIPVARHNQTGYKHGEITVFTPDCLVEKVEE